MKSIYITISSIALSDNMFKRGIIKISLRFYSSFQIFVFVGDAPRGVPLDENGQARGPAPTKYVENVNFKKQLCKS